MTILRVSISPEASSEKAQVGTDSHFWRRWVPRRYQGLQGGARVAVAVSDEPTRLPGTVRNLRRK